MVNERLRLIRSSLELSQKAFGDKLGIPQTTYANYESGKASIPDDLKQKLADINVNLHWLITGQGPMYLGQDENATAVAMPREMMTPKGPVPMDGDVIMVPIVEQKLSAGPGQEFINFSAKRFALPVLARLVKKYPKDKLVVAEVRGDSMKDASLFDGDWVVFVKELVDIDDIYVISIDGECFIKMLIFDRFDRTVTIRSENDKYPPKTVSVNDDRLVIMGKVVGWIHSM